MQRRKGGRSKEHSRLRMNRALRGAGYRLSPTGSRTYPQPHRRVGQEAGRGRRLSSACNAQALPAAQPERGWGGLPLAIRFQGYGRDLKGSRGTQETDERKEKPQREEWGTEEGLHPAEQCRPRAARQPPGSLVAQPRHTPLPWQVSWP